jgi:hypothetical protein
MRRPHAVGGHGEPAFYSSSRISTRIPVCDRLTADIASARTAVTRLGPEQFTTTGDPRLKRIITPVTVHGYRAERASGNGGVRVIVNAVWDMGVRHTCVSERLVQTLGLRPASFLRINSEAAYLINVHFSEGLVVAALPVGMMGQSNDPSFDLLVGMDVISIGQFSIAVIRGETLVSYRGM